jgi:uncharacterized protein
MGLQMHPSLIFQAILLLISAFAASVAALAGFGIGSILTPLLATQIEMKLAVAAISIPHLVASIVRFWILKEHVNKQVVIRFGTFSAIGGLIGAWFHSRASDPLLVYIFAALLMIVGLRGLTGWMQELQIARSFSWLAGIISGGLGGLVGNQGGIRAAALLGFELSKDEFVATATAIAIIVDLARMPIYLMTEGENLIAIWSLIAISTAGCLIGTFVGKQILSKLSEKVFRGIVSGLIFVLGAYMATQAKTSN